MLEGGEAMLPGRDGYYVKPALLEGSLENVAAREEIFGPVAFLTVSGAKRRRSLGQSDRLRAGQQRLDERSGAGRRVAESMRAGNSWINGHNLFPHGVPYAGVNKSGMGGGVLSVETLLDYWRRLSVVRPLSSRRFLIRRSHYSVTSEIPASTAAPIFGKLFERDRQRRPKRTIVSPSGRRRTPRRRAAAATR